VCAYGWCSFPQRDLTGSCERVVIVTVRHDLMIACSFITLLRSICVHELIVKGGKEGKEAERERERRVCERVCLCVCVYVSARERANRESHACVCACV